MLLTDALIAFDGIDLSGQSNEVRVEMARTDHNATVFGSGGRRHRAGIIDMTANAIGFWSPETDAASVIPTPDVHDLVIAVDRAPGAVAFVAGVEVLASQVGGQVDSLAPWTASFASARRGGAHRGQVAFYGPLATAGVGGGLELGALEVGERITLTLHTFDLDAEATVQLQSHTSNGWSSPTIEDSATVDALGVLALTVEGPVPRTWWRVAFPAVDGPSSFLATFHRH